MTKVNGNPLNDVKIDVNSGKYVPNMIHFKKITPNHTYAHTLKN